MSVPGNSKIIHCGIHFNIPYFIRWLKVSTVATVGSKCNGPKCTSLCESELIGLPHFYIIGKASTTASLDQCPNFMEDVVGPAN